MMPSIMTNYWKNKKGDCRPHLDFKHITLIQDKLLEFAYNAKCLKRKEASTKQCYYLACLLFDNGKRDLDKLVDNLGNNINVFDKPMLSQHEAVNMIKYYKALNEINNIKKD